MSRTITLDSGPTSSTTSSFRTLPAAAVFLAACGLVAVTLLDGSAVITAAPQASALPAVPITAPTGDTSVPDASTVFAGRDGEIEEFAPTF